MNRRRIAQFIALLLAVVISLFVGKELVRASPVLFPASDFEFRGKHQRFHLFVDEPIDRRLRAVLDQVEEQLRALEIDEPDHEVRLFLLGDRDHYATSRSFRTAP